MKLDIESKILIPFLILIIVPTLTVGAIFYWSSYKLFLNSQKESMTDELDMITKHIDSMYTDAGSGYADESKAKQEAINYLRGYAEDDIVIIDSNTSNRLLGPEYMGIPLTFDEQVHFETYSSKIAAYKRFPKWGWVIGIATNTSRFAYELQEIQKYTLIVTIISIIMAVELSILLAHNISRPIRKLASICDSISEGKFQGLISMRRKDEIGTLAHALNNMLIKQKEYNRKVLEIKKSNEDILRSINIGIIAINKSRKIVGINQAARNLIKGRYMVKDKDGKIVGALLPHLMIYVDKILINGGKEKIQVWEVENREGVVFYFEVNINILRKEDGSIDGAICSISDITSRRKVESRMERVNRLVSLGEIAAGLAHEIRNPLAGIKTSSQVLYNRLKGDNDNLVLIEAVEFEIDRINGLISDLLSFARSRSANKEKVNIRTVVIKAVELMQNEMRNKNIQFSIQSESFNTCVFADKNQMEQVFLNIIMNAVKAMKGGGQLLIRIYNNIEEGPEKLFISFSDTGVGIDSDNIDKIFDPFYTTDPSGTGLGLSVVHKLVTENDGDIEVYSKLGDGTTFIIGLQAIGGVCY